MKNNTDRIYFGTKRIARGAMVAISVLLCLGSISCRTNLAQEGTPQASGALSDGIYPVLAIDATAPVTAAAAEQRWLIYEQRFVKEELRSAPSWLLLPRVPAVRLELAEAPSEDGDRLLLTFTEAAGQELSSFTGRWVDKRAVVVIGGEVVTMHMIRQAITGGKLQVSC